MLRALGFRLLHGLRRRDELLSEMGLQRAFERWPSDRTAAFQSERLARLLRHAATHVPHYRDLAAPELAEVEARDAFEALRSLPPLDKEPIRRAPESFLAGNLPPQRAQPNDTGGSTGSVLRFHIDRASGDARNATTFIFYEWLGVHPTDPQAMLWGAAFDAPARRSLSQQVRARVHPLLFLSSFDLSDATLARYLRDLENFKPTLITSYPSPMTRLAEHAELEAVRLPSLRAIISSAEQIFPSQKERIERAFGVPVVNRYGSREFANVAQECELGDGLHVASHRLLVEILDDEDRPVENGQQGEIVVTDLLNYAHPLIRYRTGDLASWQEGNCACGRSLPRIRAIEGRTMHLVRTRSGRRVAGTFWTLMLRKVSPRITNFQVVQESIDRITVHLQLDGAPELEQEERARLHQWVAEVAPDLAVEIDPTGRFVETRAGKRLVVLSRL